MKKLLFFLLLFTSCEVLDTPDVFDGTLPCYVTGTPEDFCTIEIVQDNNLCIIRVDDNYFPDFGEIEYLVVIQYYINDVFYCNYINESTTRTFFVPRYQLQDARLHIVRTVIDKDGYVINQIESNLVRVTDCIIR